ncbi:hypothetical protein BAUCODRAFT_31161 [Baudoinia panamericana UAMH 10762]|uniref:Uncharacterized protein n=1 Tax=Baudoinia panamericana (strain UAMH 10762) TaxID=717646 RepID=M2N4H5_BAUPA|nr:uncharacterized protein BAUCODRAFT_31161 [Baudoinia panamericana UAMH 10762]EMC98888.1 hypothetical protein BAUCODRAFT_31161 [Baudoinia panamericana UAMH 10762]
MAVIASRLDFYNFRKNAALFVASSASDGVEKVAPEPADEGLDLELPVRLLNPKAVAEVVVMATSSRHKDNGVGMVTAEPAVRNLDVELPNHTRRAV